MSLDRFRLTDQVALVTGGGQGIGRATAVALAEAGADVVVCARTKDDLDETVRLVEATGRRGHAVVCDVMRTEELDRLVGATLAAFGRLDVLVNNAGGSGPTRSLDVVLTDPGLRAQFEANVPMRRAGEPEDVACAVVYLASPASAYVTGRLLHVDGGVNSPAIDVPAPPLEPAPATPVTPG